MPGDLCGAIRLAGLAAEGARGTAAEGHRDALAGLLPETRALLDGIDVSTLVGLRDRAFLGVLVYSFARVGAAVSLRVADYYAQDPSSFFRCTRRAGATTWFPPTTRRRSMSMPTWRPRTSPRTVAGPCSGPRCPIRATLSSRRP